MSTKCLYLDDTCMFECDGSVLNSKSEGEEFAIICDQTVFHPQGGGQPADQGTIKSSSASFHVCHVVKRDGVVEHIGSFADENKFDIGDQVHMAIEKERRIINARLHLAGHLIDYALSDLGLKGELVPSGGNLSPQGPYVDYTVTNPQLAIDAVSNVMKGLEEKCNEMISQDLESKVFLAEYKDVPLESQIYIYI